MKLRRFPYTPTLLNKDQFEQVATLLETLTPEKITEGRNLWVLDNNLRYSEGRKTIAFFDWVLEAIAAGNEAAREVACNL